MNAKVTPLRGYSDVKEGDIYPISGGDLFSEIGRGFAMVNHVKENEFIYAVREGFAHFGKVSGDEALGNVVLLRNNPDNGLEILAGENILKALNESLDEEWSRKRRVVPAEPEKLEWPG